jgi:hypothetical protein
VPACYCAEGAVGSREGDQHDEFKPSDGNETRPAEIALQLVRLDAEMACPNIKKPDTPSSMVFTGA